MTTKRVKRGKPDSDEYGFQYGTDGIPSKGLIPIMNDLADQLPDDMRPHGKRIVGLLNISVISVFAIFLIGATVASLTGHSDQIMNIFAYDITGVGIATVGAIAYTLKKTL